MNKRRNLVEKGLIFMEENIIIKRVLGFIGPSNDKSFSNKP